MKTKTYKVEIRMTYDLVGTENLHIADGCVVILEDFIQENIQEAACYVRSFTVKNLKFDTTVDEAPKNKKNQITA